ncbi:hypothetical protein TVAG_295340 [Trichomonas vaginalis G3]|uniref:DUF3447 domain-containing protein n=1 Tax=Trichomonas vaginalis (strain ATCC PRA-98 / G3) TaxID=412133 RepID=A2DL90_TRIV3|nr:spectrin binding [Trichomonas vaginalis G3]EAY18881.1 hypothetical protein TVAG_295340 [Trichomonas vaginalis G3]KAI5526000.1 spectrin binding [Trichomonas vaginalis G3]|eukprot:XP_001579867.1 hypothetical protein [Trichomonas vaginalis G3]
MSETDFNISELFELTKDYSDAFNALYRLHTFDEGEIEKIYQNIKNKIIETKIISPSKFLESISHALRHNNRYLKSYFRIFEKLYEDYHPDKVDCISFSGGFDKLIYDKYKFSYKHPDTHKDFSIEFLNENTIYRSILDDDIKSFIGFTERSRFDEKQIIDNSLFPREYHKIGWLELCCYYDSVNCFKFLRTKFNSKITKTCLGFSFLGGNQEIIIECLKYEKPDTDCSEYVIIAHNNDFINFLITECNVTIYLSKCPDYNNVDACLIYFDIKKSFKENLTFICEFQIPSLCKYFILHGADVNIEKSNKTAAYYAAKFNWKEILELLISHGLDINQHHALFAAAIYNHVEMAELLLANGANINKIGPYNYTPILEAVEHNSNEMIDFLYSHGADINVYDLGGSGVLYFAAENKNVEKAEFFISHGLDLNKDPSKCIKPLFLAVRNNLPRIVELLISHGVNINAEDKKGKVPLHYAIKNDSVSIARLLISHGVDFNAITYKNQTFLQYAVEHHGYEVPKLLISLGSDIHQIDSDG